jgi:hypothetical protein
LSTIKGYANAANHAPPAAWRSGKPNKVVEVVPKRVLEAVKFDVDWIVDEGRRAYELERVLNREHAKLQTWSPRWWSSLKELNRVRGDRIAIESVQPYNEMAPLPGVTL